LSQDGTPPVEESNVVHSGTKALEVNTPSGFQHGGFAYQDLTSFPANTSYTLSAWVYPSLNEEVLQIGFGWDRGGGSATGFSYIDILPDHIYYSAWGQSATANTNTNQYYGSWHQFALAVDASTLTAKLLIDGQQVGTATPSGSPVPQTQATVFVGQTSGQTVPGDRFYWDDVSLTLGATGPLHWWKADGNANDSIGTANGTLIDGTYGPGAPGETTGKSFSLDGVDDYVNIPSTAMSGITGAISVSAWVNPATVSLPPNGSGNIIGQYDTHDTQSSFDLGVLNGGQIEWGVVGPSCQFLGSGGALVVQTTTGIPANQWTQVAGTFDPATQQMHILINGQPVATQTTESNTISSLCVTSSPVQIGAAESISGQLLDFFQGLIDEVKLYSSDITSSAGGSLGPPTIAPTHIAVLGDSYSSGEGTYNAHPPSVDYIPGTANGTDKCHRSVGAYGPPLGVAISDFVACSGATISDIENGKYGEPSQLNVLSPADTTIFLTASGDDLGFSTVLQQCTDIPGFHHTTDQDCKSAIHNAEQQIPKALGTSSGAPDDNLTQLLNAIVVNTGGAKIVLVGYPRLFPANGQEGCNWVTAKRQRWLNRAANKLAKGEEKVARLNPFVTFVDVRSLFAPDEVCGSPLGFINDLQLNTPPAVNNCPADYIAFPFPLGGVCSQSYHPNVYGYLAEAALLSGYTNAHIPSPTRVFVRSGSTITLTTGSTVKSTPLAVTAVWPAGFVNVALVSPTGHRIGTPLGQAPKGDYTMLTVPHPSPGAWKIQLSGTLVPVQGEWVTLRVSW